MEKIKFSVLVPVYNVEKYIDECIQSVIVQSYPNWELVLVDDGTQDNSGIICDRYANGDKRIKVIHKNNQGLISARRTGIANANGDYYCFLDSDDYLDKDALLVLYNIICEYNCDCIVFGMRRFCDDRIVYSLTESGVILKDKRTILKKCLNDSSYNPMCRKCVRSNVFDNKRDYSPFYKYSSAEDLLQSVEIYNNIASLQIINDILYNYRVNPNSITQTINYENFQVDHSIREYVLDYIENSKMLTRLDIKEYIGYALQIISNEVLTILRFETSYKNKKKILNQIRTEEYFIRLTKYHCGIKRMGIKSFLVITCLRINSDFLFKLMEKM